MNLKQISKEMNLKKFTFQGHGSLGQALIKKTEASPQQHQGVWRNVRQKVKKHYFIFNSVWFGIK